MSIPSKARNFIIVLYAFVMSSPFCDLMPSAIVALVSGQSLMVFISCLS